MKLITLCFLTILLAVQVHAQELTVKLTDQDGSPIADAIVKINSVSTEDNKPELPIAIMDQINKQFSPYVLLARKGQSVSFPNSDEIRHHVYSFSKAKPFEIKLYKNNPTEPIKFNDAGIVELGCNIHDKMVGYIYIADSGIYTKTDNKGFATATLDEQNISFVHVWHPRLSTNRMEHLKVTLPEKNNQGLYEITLPLIQQVEKKVKRTFKRKFKKKNP